MSIKRSSIEIVDFTDDEFKDESEKYFCPHCKDYGFQVPLRNRIYPEGEQVPEDERAKWKMCFDCGLIVPIYELEKESKIKDSVELSDNPFDVAKDQFLGVPNRNSADGIKNNARKERQKELDDIQDKDIKMELQKGNQVTIHQWE